ncbi:hypothetical protein RND71_024964 [Anisodus tanguticus]|uniref:Uncharacterized protein n=1 Tax=Anisodus tanguticus TaxID=243964 RepID=A0AAE1RQI9_9SOLA|nr:hypothetical protein RND71_024964 [Anisodus tanguticus]
MFWRKAPSHGAFVRSSPSPVYFTVETLMEKIVGPFSADSNTLASTDVKVNPIVRFHYFKNPGDGCGEMLHRSAIAINWELAKGKRSSNKVQRSPPGLNKAFRVSEEHDSEREKNGNLFMAAYLSTFKNSCDSLTYINAPMSQYDTFTFLLAGLPLDYESFVTMTKLQRPKPTMDELRSSLLIHESCH